MSAASDKATPAQVREDVVRNISGLIALFERYPVGYWPEALRKYQAGIEANDPAVIMSFAAHNRSGFAGLLDVLICRENGHDVTPEQGVAIEAQLSALRSRVISGVNKLEHLQYNVPDGDGGFLCPVCGYHGVFDGTCFDMRGGVIGTVICSCCLYEPGFDDDQGASAKAQHTVTHSIMFYRDEWVKEGKPWRGKAEAKPADWDAAKQLAHLFQVAPYLPHD